MNKKIVFLFLFLSKVIQGMEELKSNTEIIFCNADIISCITESLCMSYKYRPKPIRKDMRALFETNTFLHNYYAQEKNAQKIIRLCASHFNHNDTYIGSNDKYIAQKLGCHAIKKKIDYFSTLVRDKEIEFTEKDLQDVWYLNCTTNCCNRSLLYIAIDHDNFDKALLIIKNSPQLDFRYPINENILSCIVTKWRTKKFKNVLWWQLEWFKKEFDKKLLEIVELLLQKKIDPNVMTNGYTPLQEAAQVGNQDLFRLLLQYGANPLKKYKLSVEWSTDTIEVETCFSGWALDIIREMKIERDKK